MTLQPIGPFILIKPDPLPEVVNGIFLPEKRGGAKEYGTIIKLGKRNRNEKGKQIPFDVQEGQKVMFERMEAYDPGRIDLDGELHFLMPESKIIAVLG